jgi:hypothetical protein
LFDGIPPFSKSGHRFLPGLEIFFPLGVDCLQAVTALLFRLRQFLGDLGAQSTVGCSCHGLQQGSGLGAFSKIKGGSLRPRPIIN